MRLRHYIYCRRARRNIGGAGVLDIVNKETATRVGGRLDLDQVWPPALADFSAVGGVAQHVSYRALAKPRRDQPATDDLKL